MRTAALRLDSFSRAASRAGHAIAPAEIEDAFQRGHEKGLHEGRERSLDDLTRQLGALREEIAGAAQRDHARRQEALASLAPVLSAIVDILAPRTAAGRLRDALAAELARLVEHPPAGRVLLRCPEDLRPDVEDCVAQSGLAAVIEPSLSGGCGVELVASRGTIVFDPMRVADELKSIVNDIMTED